MGLVDANRLPAAGAILHKGSAVDVPVAEVKQVNYVDRIYASLALFADRDRHQLTPVDLRLQEHRVFSQNGEDGVIDALVRTIDPPKFFVEFGVGDGWSCNTRFLAEVREWDGLYIEKEKRDFSVLESRYRFTSGIQCQNSEVSPTNVSQLFEKAGVPKRFGLLSIDIDGQDFWVWRALDAAFRPDIVVIEFNAEHEPGQRIVEEERDGSPRALGRLWGASLEALTALGRTKGYDLVHVEMARVNAFFVRREIAEKVALTGRVSHGSPNYGLRGRGLSDDVAYGQAPKEERRTVVVTPGQC